LEGVHTLEYRSRDLLANPEPAHSIQIVVDDTPPASSLSVGDPKYLVGGNFTTSSTPLALHADDGGLIPVGTNDTFYRLWNGTWSPWREYASSFTLAGRDGTWFVEFLSFDYLGNREDVQNVTLVLDNTPPATTILPDSGDFTTDTVFTLTATDGGSRVNVTRYRIDGGNWTNYTGGFTLPEGEHYISYFSIDNLGNREAERYLPVNVKGQPPPEANYKPLVAVVFAIILVVVGLWSSRRRPWKSGRDRKAMMKAFTITVMPFMIAEAVTGVVSHLTGALPIPPPIGLGTAVDSAILFIGLMVEAARILRRQPSLAVSDPTSDGEH